MTTHGAQRPDGTPNVRGGPSRSLCSEAAPRPAPTTWTASEWPIPPRAAIVPAKASWWWAVSAAFAVGIAVLLVLEHLPPADARNHPAAAIEEADEAEQSVTLAEALDFFGSHDDLRQEVQQLRRRLAKVEERQRRLARGLDVVD